MHVPEKLTLIELCQLQATLHPEKHYCSPSLEPTT